MKKNPTRIEFEKKCKSFEKRTLFLRVFVIYIIPIYMALSIAAIFTFIINIPGISSKEVAIFSSFEFVKLIIMYITRKEAFTLSKKSYYCLYVCVALVCITGLITEGIQMFPTAIVTFSLFFFYIYKRSFLFGQK